MRRTHRAGKLLLLAFLLVTAAGCEPDRPTNVVLISVDTLRPDHLGCYGYSRPTSPNVDKLCADSVRFDQTIAHAPSTLPSHASMLSSLLPQHHGASFALKTPLPDEVVTLAEVLRGAGYRTAAFNGGGQMRPEFGLGQGFEIYDSSERDAAPVVEKAITWLDSVTDEPFFLFLHTYEVHHPYAPDPAMLERFEQDYDGPLGGAISIELLQRINAGKVKITDADLGHIVSAYDAGIRTMDEAIGRLLAELAARNLYDDALVIFTSDHGEEFGEHGKVGWHSHTLFDELLRVPLVVKLPGTEHGGRSVAEQVRLIDVAPTVLEELGLALPQQFGGVGLRQVLEGRLDQPLPAISLKDTRGRNFESLRYRGSKWVFGRLYNLVEDPGERRNLARREAEITRRLGGELRRLLAEAEAMTAEPVGLERETAEELKALGYLD